MRFHERSLARIIRVTARVELVCEGTRNELGIEIFTRSSQGIALTVDGAEFSPTRAGCSIRRHCSKNVTRTRSHASSCAPCPHSITCSPSKRLVEMINSIKSDEYEFTIRETRTKDIINQVANMLSEIGIIYLSDFNKDVIGKMLRESIWNSIHCSVLHCMCSFRATIHWLARKSHDGRLGAVPVHPVRAGRGRQLLLRRRGGLAGILPKQINVTDRATILNFIIGLNGYTVYRH